jgi:hypothetical protein
MPDARLPLPARRGLDRALLGAAGPWAPTVDHIIRVRDGGADNAANKRAAHFYCNHQAAITEDQALTATITRYGKPPAGLTYSLGATTPGLAALLAGLPMAADSYDEEPPDDEELAVCGDSGPYLHRAQPRYRRPLCSLTTKLHRVCADQRINAFAPAVDMTSSHRSHSPGESREYPAHPRLGSGYRRPTA